VKTPITVVIVRDIREKGEEAMRSEKFINGFRFSPLTIKLASILIFFTTAALADPIVIGTVDLSNPGEELQPLNISVQKYSDGSKYPYLFRGPGPCDPNEPAPKKPVSPIVGRGPCLHLAEATKYGPVVAIGSSATVDIVFALSNWPATFPWPNWPYSVTITLGGKSQTGPYGTKEITFRNVSGTSVSLTIGVYGGLWVNGTPATYMVPGILPLRLVP
jgi:hypothetical protein